MSWEMLHRDPFSTVQGWRRGSSADCRRHFRNFLGCFSRAYSLVRKTSGDSWVWKDIQYSLSSLTEVEGLVRTLVAFW